MKWIESDSAVTGVVRPENKFSPGTLKRKKRKSPDGVTLVLGRLLVDGEPGAFALHALQFAKPLWTLKESRAWYGEHVTEFEADADGQRFDTDADADSGAETDWIDICREGTTVDGRIVESERLAHMVEDYDPSYLSAAAVLDHDTSGPAYGWVTKLRVVGPLLQAKFRDVSETLKELVKTRAYERVSVLVRLDGFSGRWYLEHVAFLGAGIPAVWGLRPPKFAADGERIRIICSVPELSGRNIVGEESESMNKEKLYTADDLHTHAMVAADKALAEQAPKFEAERSELNARIEAQDAQLQVMQGTIDTMQAEAKTAEDARRIAEIKASVDALVTDGKVLSHEAETHAEVLGSLGAKAGAKYLEMLGKRGPSVPLGRVTGNEPDAGHSDQLTALDEEYKEHDPENCKKHGLTFAKFVMAKTGQTIKQLKADAEGSE